MKIGIKYSYNLMTKLYCIIGLIIYKILLDYAFCNWISPLYSYYMQLKYVYNNEKVVLSFIILLSLLLITNFDVKYISNVLMVIQLVVMLIPMLTLYAYSDRSTIFMAIVSCSYVIQSIIISLSHYISGSKLYITTEKSYIFIMLIMSALLCIALIYSIIHYGTGSFAAFNLNNVYNIREDVSYSFPFSYIIPWVFKVICVLILLLGLYYKNIWGICIGFFSQLYFYLVYANKTTLFSLGLVLVCYFVYSKWNIIKAIIMGLIGLIIISGFLYSYTGNIIILSYLVRRTLFVPATIKFAYYDFFSKHELLHFADNSIGHLLGIESKYNMEAAKIIANYLGVPDSHCNTGYWGDAYANYGIIGVLFFSVLLILIILFIEKITSELPNQIIFPIMIVLFYNLNDSALLTWLLGGGVGLAIILFWLLRNVLRNKKNVKQIQKNYI